VSNLKRAISKNRKEAGLTIRALAKRSNVTTFTICRMARENEGTVGNLRKIANVFNKKDWELLRDGN